MVGTRKLAPLLTHAEHAGAKVVLVGDDRQFSPVDAGGGFRGLRLRLGASELTINRRQVQAWEQQAIDLVREQRVEEAIAAYREHDRIRVYESPTELAVGLVNDWFTSYKAGEQVVILAHRRAEVDRLNVACQRLRQLHGELGAERLQVADRAFRVGDRVVLGANAISRLGVANGTTGQVVVLDPGRRTLTITTEERPSRMVTLPGWYLDGEVRPGQSRRVDLAYARTDMRAQGLTRQRALLSLDGCEDTQGLYVQLSRARERTDLYLSVTPEPPLADQERAYPQAEPGDAEALLARVLERDGAKQLATDDQPPLSAQMLRRLSTHQLRELRDRLDRERAGCPPDRTAASRRAAERAAADQQARRDAEAARDAAREQLAGKVGGLRRMARPRQTATARLELAAAERQLTQASRVAAGSAERADALRHTTQRRQAWLEANDTRLKGQERAVARELAWRNRADAAALAATRPGWLEAALGPLPDHQEGRDAWRGAAVALDRYRRLWGLSDHRPAQHPRRTDRAVAAAATYGPRRGRPAAAMLGPEPRRDLSQRRGWKTAHSALDRLERVREQQEERHSRARRAERERHDERVIS
jgi:hypothetical protein